MKSFKNMLIIVGMFTIVSMNAKQMGVRSTPATQPEITTPITRPTLTEPTAREMERRIAAQVDTMSSIIEMNNNATQQFIALMQEANLSSKAKQEYLQAATQLQNMVATSGTTNSNKIRTAKGMGLISTVRPQNTKKTSIFEGLTTEE